MLKALKELLFRYGFLGAVISAITGFLVGLLLHFVLSFYFWKTFGIVFSIFFVAFLGRGTYLFYKNYQCASNYARQWRTSESRIMQLLTDLNFETKRLKWMAKTEFDKWLERL